MKTNRGSLSAFVVSLTMACLALVAFVHDSGRTLAHYVTVADSAQNAARVGAQAISDIRLGNPQIDSDEAISRAQQYLKMLGFTGQITSDHHTVTVRIRQQVPSTMLGSFGVHSRSISVSRTALVMGK